MDAAATMKIVWMPKDKQKTHFLLGLDVKTRCRRLKRNDPMAKDRIEVPDFFQRFVPAVGPRPR
jgi:hypothetical protein